MMIYVMAMYAFYVTVMAVINMVRYRKYHSPVMSAAKAVNLAAALVSMLSLEIGHAERSSAPRATAAISGDHDRRHRRSGVRHRGGIGHLHGCPRQQSAEDGGAHRWKRVIYSGPGSARRETVFRKGSI